jgi:endoglucanase
MPHRPYPYRRRRRGPALIAATGLLALAGAIAVPQLASAAPDPGPAVKVNQVAYPPGLPKQATIVSTSTTPIGWTLRNSGGATVASGQTTVRGNDPLSGDFVHIADFSTFDTPGTGYVLSAAGANSHPFDISADPVKRLRYDSLAFFYHQRSGIAIDAQLVGSQYARPAGHLNVAPNQGDNNVPCRASCGYTLDVRGGWYDAGDQGKYVVNGGISAWQLLNTYERAATVPGGDTAPLGDGKLAIPERSNGVPDILDEARWEVEFLLKMQVPDGRTNAGLVHHKIHDQNWTGIPQRPETDSQPRLLSPVSTAATLNMAAVAAQASRIFKPFDAAFSARALAAAEKAYAAAKANPNRLADPNDGTGGGAYSDNSVTDEFYWAAAELYASTGSAAYRADVTGAALYRGRSFADRGYDWGWVGGLGDITLALVPNGLPAADVAATRSAITGFADALLAQTARQGYPAPFSITAANYVWGSNGQVANNAGVLALAFDFTGQQKYRAGVFAAYDYLLGRNPLNQSYVSGYGEKAVRNVHHRFWANQANSSLPIAPPGALSGGPNSALQDPVAQAQLAGCAPQKCFVDDIGAYSVNEVAVNWNSAFAWLASWAAEHAGGGTPADAPPTAPGAPAFTNITSSGATISWAAATDDKGITGYRVTAITGDVALVLGTPSTTSLTVTNLSADREYQVTVAAIDTAGQQSRSAPGLLRTLPAASTSACEVAYSANSWSTGFTGTVTLTNTGATAWSAWTLQFGFPGNQQVTQGWSGTWSQSGSAVTATNLSWNGGVPPGGSVGIGFNGTYSGSNASPTAFTVNGSACTIG